MTGKAYRWQANWERLQDGSLRHISGLVMRRTPGDALGDLTADRQTLDALFAWLRDVRRTSPHDMQRAASNVATEAAAWQREHAHWPS